MMIKTKSLKKSPSLEIIPTLGWSFINDVHHLRGDQFFQGIDGQHL